MYRFQLKDEKRVSTSNFYPEVLPEVIVKIMSKVFPKVLLEV